MKDNRKFGRSSEVLFNEKLYTIVKQLETLSLERKSGVAPKAKIDKALWIDPDDENDLKYSLNGQWYPFYKRKLQMITEILEEYTPVDPVPGQLWLNEGILMYFDGMEWLVVKAGCLDNDQFNAASYHDFLIIDPLFNDGELVIDTTAKTPVKKTQFLIPNVETDKFFIDGHNNEDYEALTNVAIQYDTDRIQDRRTSAVHVNPTNLLDIRKNLMLVNKDPEDDGTIRVTQKNKEFYGFTHGRGRLLLKGIDYVNTRGNFIKLTEKSRRKFDFIMSIEYIFGKSKNKGRLIKQQADFNKGSSISIREDIDYNDKYIFIFEDGYVKTIDQDNFEIKNDELILTGNLKNKQIQIINIHMNNVLHKGKISKGNIIVSEDPMFDDMVDNPFAFIETKDKYEFIKIDKNKIIEGKYEIPESLNIEGNQYLTFSLPKKNDNKNIQFVGTSSVRENTATQSENKGMVYITGSEVGSRSELILFIDGKIIPKSMYEFNPSKASITGLPNRYIGLKTDIFVNHNGNLLIDEKIEQVLIPVSETDKSLVYVEEHLICDPATVLSYNEPINGYENEVRKIYNNNGSYKWIVRKGSKWVELKDSKVQKIKLLGKRDNIILPKYIQIESGKKESTDKIFNTAHTYILEFLSDISDKITIKSTKVNENKLTVIVDSPKNHNLKPLENLSILSKGSRDELVFSFYLKNVEIFVPEYYQSELVDIINDKFSTQEVRDDSKVALDLEIKDMLNKMNKDNDYIRDGELSFIGLDARITIDEDTNFAKVETFVSMRDHKDVIGTIRHLDYTVNGYITNKNNINIVQTFGGESAYTYSYRFASYVEHPRRIREFSEIDLLENDDNNKEGYQISYDNFYEPNRNELSIYLDGVRQYYVDETSNNRFRIQGELGEESIAYIDKALVKASCVSEPSEGGKDLSATRNIISINEQKEGMYNTYKTSIDLYPGYNRIFIDGVRQPSDVFKIIDRRHFMIHNITEEMKNRNMEILIEHKEDISIKEKSITLSNYEDLIFKEDKIYGIIDVEKYDIDRSILETREEIMIYIDGVYIGNSYIIDRERELIILTPQDINTIEENAIFFKALSRYRNLQLDLENVNITKKEKERLEEEIRQLELYMQELEKAKLETNIIFEWR